MSYYIAVMCKNCGWNGLLEVKEGELVESQECPTCKCLRVIRQYGATAYKKD